MLQCKQSAYTALKVLKILNYFLLSLGSLHLFKLVCEVSSLNTLRLRIFDKYIFLLFLRIFVKIIYLRIFATYKTFCTFVVYFIDIIS